MWCCRSQQLVAPSRHAEALRVGGSFSEGGSAADNHAAASDLRQRAHELDYRGRFAAQLAHRVGAIGFEIQELGVAIDVLWMHISKRADDPEQLFGFFRHGKLLVLIARGDYYQAGFVIPKGGIDAIKQRGLPSLYDEIVALAPFLKDRITELDDWSKIKLLTVQINRLRKWCREGLLCIGDSAHAMSPAGGVGINLALQDAVATANLLATKLKAGPVTIADLELVQRRREWPTRVIQAMQAIIHRRVVTGRESSSGDSLPIFVRLLLWFPALRTLPARLIGIGPRPERIRSPEALES